MSAREYTLNYLKWVRDISRLMMKDWPADQTCFKASANDNHLLWVLGHLASTDVWIASELGIAGVKTPESWGKLFSSGSKPTANAKDYPPFDEVKRTFEAVREQVVNWLAEAPESALSTSLKEKTGGFANDTLDAFLKLAWHEGWHFGQVATGRKTLGLPSAMG